MTLIVAAFLHFTFTMALLLVILAFISYCFPRLLSINHKSTHPCFSPLHLKLAAQKLVMRWNSSMRCLRLVLVLVIFLWSVELSVVSLS
jgi:hypothetical protein